MVGLLLLAIGLAGGFAVAWQKWPPLLKYRETRLTAEYNSEIRRYLQGSDSLDVAARRLAQVIIKLGFIIDRQQGQEGPSGQGSTMTITAMEGPPDIPRDDPRVEELVLNAFKLANPPGVSEAFKAHSAGMWDSIIHSRGYRSVP
jgi:hypothetical protein